MINLNAIPKPYDNIRPKGFFTARKNQMIDKIATHQSGKTYNSAFKAKKVITARLPKGYDASWEELKVILPWALFLGLAMINLMGSIL
ncbi:MAG: hypothetical protein HKN68_00840 [Saprospiraceae bacterium]|nr:hypothetical protein [Saprospiraceae bacterium]